jgi:hypothetical protein
MSKDARTGVEMTGEARRKFDECVAAMAACGFGSEGPPMDTTFAQIEDFSDEVAQMVARAVGERLGEQHAAHFQEESTCPTCGTACPRKERPAEREIQTRHGPVPLREPVCHCSVCHRDFFPSADRLED